MPNIELTDKFGLDVTLELGDGSALISNFKNLRELKFPELDVAKIRDLPIAELGEELNPFGVHVSTDPPLKIGLGGAVMTAKAGAGMTLRIRTPDHPVAIMHDYYGAPIGIEEGQCCVSLELVVSFSEKASQGPFGFSAGSEINIGHHRLFSVNDERGFIEILSEFLNGVSLPSEVEDIKTMPKDSVTTYAGLGALKLSGTVNLFSAVNPLATASSVPIGVLKVSSAQLIGAGASFTCSGAYQIRLHRRDDRSVQLGLYRKQGTQFAVSAAVSAGISTQFGETDMIEKLLRAVSTDPNADAEQLKRAGLDDGRVKAIGDAVAAGIQRSLELALHFEFGLLRTGEAAFQYRIDPEKLDVAAGAAITAALRGEWAQLIQDENPLPRGIGLAKSILIDSRARKHTLKVNLLGIYNCISVSELLLKGVVLYDADTGELTISDTVSASRIRSSAINFGSNFEKLRSILAESFLITAIYRGSQFIVSPPELKSAHSYFEIHARTNRQTMKDNLDVAEALGLLSPGDAEDYLGNRFEFGRSLFLAETRYDDQTARALFLEKGRPRPQRDFERVGREALGLLIRQGDPNDYRRVILQDRVWMKMKKAGQANFTAILPGLTREQVLLVVGDYTIIVWWAETMAKAAESLHQIDRLLAKSRGPESQAFKSARKELAKSLHDVAGRTKERFGEPWGLITMDLAANRRSAAEVRVIADLVTLHSSRPELPA